LKVVINTLGDEGTQHEPSKREAFLTSYLQIIKLQFVCIFCIMIINNCIEDNYVDVWSPHLHHINKIIPQILKERSTPLQGDPYKKHFSGGCELWCTIKQYWHNQQTCC
jgi:hypothetical protein